MQAYKEKELPEREKLALVIEIVRKFREKGISFGQANEILAMARAELPKLPLS